MSRTWVLVLNAYLYWTNKFIHGFINIYFDSIFTSYIRNPCSILKEYRRNFGHGFGLKNWSVYKLGYQLEIEHFLSKKKLTWSPPTFYIFTINRLSVWKMALFGKKKFGRGSPYIWSFLSGFLKEKRAYLCIFGLSNKTPTAHIFPSKMITKVPPGDIKVQPSQVSSCLKRHLNTGDHCTIFTYLLFLISTQLWFPICLGFKQLLQ